MKKELNYAKLRSMVARCQWTFAKTMPFAPHEYIVKDRCPLAKEEFEYFVEMQRQYGIKERWGKYNNPYLYVDDYKYWTMGAPLEETTVINRAKVCVVNEAHELYEGIERIKAEQDMEQHQYIDEYVSRQLGFKDDDKGYNFNLLSGRLEELSACVSHLERMRRNFSHEIMKGWSEQLAEAFPNCRIVEDLGPADIVYTGITIPYKDIPDAMAVRIEIAYKSLYYGLTYMPKTKDLRNEMQEEMNFVNEAGDFIKGNDWLYYKYTSYNCCYESLRQLIVKMVNYTNEIPVAVQKAALFPYVIVHVGDYQGQKVYGYDAGMDDGRGIGLPHVILFDGHTAKIVYETDNEEIFALLG